MKQFLIIIALSLLSLLAQGQNLNGIKYVHVPTLTYNDGRVDIWGISSRLHESFSNKGFIVLNERSSSNEEISSNPCLLLICEINHTNVYTGVNRVIITLRDCNNNIVATGEGGAMGMTLQDDYNKATRRAFSDIDNIPYHFSASATPTLNLPQVESLPINEEVLKNYYVANELNQIEGIYKSYQSQGMGYYKIGIYKTSNIYTAVILESEFSYWKLGEVKAYFEPSSVANIYSTKWYMANKQPVETFAVMENPAMLSIEFRNPQSNEKQTATYIKMYPSVSTESGSSSSRVSATGSGFLVSPDGIIATNAHVIKGASELKVSLPSDIGSIEYSAVLLLKDESNDVALLKIQDSKFQALTELPYSIIQSTDIGENVFTIGYPLNSIMGDNYKVTNGIVSASSGLKDDVRFLQITTPLQPGNSGGPLFNADGNIIGLTTAKLNEDAVGTSIENVNYAIKSIYLTNIYNMLPNSKSLSNNSKLVGLELKEQIKELRKYVCLIRAY
jgi:S1-C subfamily serine protease